MPEAIRAACQARDADDAAQTFMLSRSLASPETGVGDPE
jgi:hypothetical protein